MELIVKVTSTNQQTSLSDLLRSPLGLDIWEVAPDYLILRAPEAPIERLAFSQSRRDGDKKRSRYACMAYRRMFANLVSTVAEQYQHFVDAAVVDKRCELLTVQYGIDHWFCVDAFEIEFMPPAISTDE